MVLKRHIEELTGKKFDLIIIGGGITGAAINAAVGMNYYQEYNEAVKSMTRPGEQYLPDSNNVYLYNQLYEKVYSKMYKRLHPLYDQIRNITGYPKKI